MCHVSAILIGAPQSITIHEQRREGRTYLANLIRDAQSGISASDVELLETITPVLRRIIRRSPTSQQWSMQKVFSSCFLRLVDSEVAAKRLRWTIFFRVS